MFSDITKYSRRHVITYYLGVYLTGLAVFSSVLYLCLLFSAPNQFEGVSHSFLLDFASLIIGLALFSFLMSLVFSVFFGKISFFVLLFIFFSSSPNLFYLLVTYLIVGIVLSRFIDRRVIYWNQLDSTENVTQEKIKMILYWILVFPLFIIKIFIAKYF